MSTADGAPGTAADAVAGLTELERSTLTDYRAGNYQARTKLLRRLEYEGYDAMAVVRLLETGHG